MTPQEKAIELYNKYDNLIRDFTKGISIKDCSKQCALIAIDEILNMNLCLPVVLTIQDEKDIENSIKILSEYWKEVKQEIEKL